jgi:hypothetical protein
MQKKVLTEQAVIFYGDIDMPKGFEISTEINLTTTFYNQLIQTKIFHSQELGIC